MMYIPTPVEIPASHAYLLMSFLNVFILLTWTWAHDIPSMAYHTVVAVFLAIMFRQEWNKEVGELESAGSV